MAIKHPCAQADTLWHKYVAVKRPSLLPMFEVRDLLIRVVTHRCGTGLSSCRCFLSHSSDCNWTGGVIFKHYFCVTGRDQPSSGGERMLCNLSALGAPYRRMSAWEFKTHLRKTWKYISLFSSAHTAFWFYRTYLNIITPTELLFSKIIQEGIFRRVYGSVWTSSFMSFIPLLFLDSYSGT